VGRLHTVAGAGADVGSLAQHCSPCILDRENGTYFDSLREQIAATSENGGSWANTASDLCSPGSLIRRHLTPELLTHVGAFIPA
jgi:hypothetical protein